MAFAGGLKQAGKLGAKGGRPMSGEAWEGLNGSLRQRVQELINASGGRIFFVSGYRSVERQSQLWNAALKKYGSAAAARKWVAPPGKSNHNHGNAVDLGGDYALLKKLAPQFGLRLPMSWEPWHVELIDGEHNADGHTDPPDNHQEPDKFTANISTLAAMFGVDMEESYDPGTEDADMSQSAGSHDDMDIDTFMERLAGVENRSGNANVANKRTGAHGLYQIIPSNWGPWAKEAGLGANAPKTPENQTRVARFKMQQYYNQFKSWAAVAAAWYGGPGAAQRYLKNPNDPYLHRKQGHGNEPSIFEYIQRVV